MPVIGDRPTLTFEGIIYATDLSVSSQNAGRYAALLARYFSIPLFVAHAFILSQAAMEVEADPSFKSQHRKNLQSLLSKEASALTHGSGEAHALLLEGDPKEAILKLAEQRAPSLVVLGTHAGNWVEHKLIGSVAEAILRSSRWPCLTVGPRVRAASSATLPFRHILYATDFTAAAAHAAAHAVSVAEAFGARIDVLNVIAEDAIDHPDRIRNLEKRFYDVLERLVPEQAKEFCDPRTFVAAGKAHEQILRHIRENKVDLLVLGIKKTSHLGMEMRTSGAFGLITSAECPVLTISG